MENDVKHESPRETAVVRPQAARNSTARLPPADASSAGDVVTNAAAPGEAKMHDIGNFTLKDMAECSGALRTMGAGATSMEETANRMVRYLYDHFLDGKTGLQAFVLARLFKTHRYDELDEELRAAARSMIGAPSPPPSMKCLVLLATAGARPEWNSRSNSQGHRVIPLPSEQFVNRLPMVRQLVQQLGLEIKTLLEPDPKVIMDLTQKTYNVFYVPDAIGNEYVPAQKEFVVPFGVRSVIGFGGILPSGNLYATILFSRACVPPETAEMFKTLALSISISLLPFVGGRVFG